MSRVLVLTTDLPFFPGKNGHDFFNLRHLAEYHKVSVIAPCYDWCPTIGVANLEKCIGRGYFWPRPVVAGSLFVQHNLGGSLPRWLAVLPRRWRQILLRRMLAIENAPDDAYEKLAILANCAPHLLAAMRAGPWQAFVLIQSNTEPWLAYLPTAGAKLIYFHDVRADYFRRCIPVAGQPRLKAREITWIRRQESRVVSACDCAGFVSDLDLQRAKDLFSPSTECGVAPIPVDTAYFSPAPEGWARPPLPTVLFTGHLSHPPNVDAVLYFLDAIWPLIKRAVPNARFQAVGLLPAKVLSEAIGRIPDCELHPNVPDIRPYFWDASVYVVPMRFGGGVRQKLFEAWSMHVPVVCTSMAAEGTGAQSGRHCWLEDTPNAFAERVVQYLSAPGKDDLAHAAKVFVEERNSIAAAAPRFRELVEQTVRTRRQRPYRLLFDLRWMEIGRAGGTEQMTHELIHALAGHDRRNRFRAFVPRQTYFEWDLDPGFNLQATFSDAPELRIEALRATFANRLAESLDTTPVLTPEMRSLRALRELDFDLVHATGGYIHPSLEAFPHILTVHDLQHLTYPNFFGKTEWEERERLYRDSANRAVHIIAISEFTRLDLHRHYGIPLEKITTVWNIPSRHAWQSLGEPQRSQLLNAMGLVTPFIFFPGHCWPHKNHARLVEAFGLMIPHIPTDMKLVLTGRPFPADHPALKLVHQLGLQTRVVHLGYRSPLEMKALFRSCEVLAFPSLFEGFGMPVAEAIIAGCPVACSRTTSLPEIAGDAALTFDPENPHDIAGRLLECVNAPAIRQRLHEAALRRRTLFRARTVALQTLSIYQRVFDCVYRS